MLFADFTFNVGEQMKKMLSAAVVLVILLVSGCASEPEAEPNLAVEPATPSATPTEPGPARNDRGQIIKKVGQVGGWLQEDGESYDLAFKVNSIKPIDCGDQAPKPTGMTIAVALEVETSPDFEGPLTIDGQPGFISFDSHNWKGYAANGTRMNDVATDVTINCHAHEAEELPFEIGKAEKAEGIIVLDVTTPTGEIAYEMGDGAWVWEYPSTKSDSA
jgi:hypothetical protein